MKDFISASNFSENLLDQRENKSSHDKVSRILTRSSSFAMLPKDVGGTLSRLTEKKGYRKCSLCSKNCAYRATDKIIDGEHVYMNHCQTENIYFFTRG